jgi:dissimilatory sulfite reductase related protein
VSESNPPVDRKGHVGRHTRTIAGRSILFDEKDFIWNGNEWTEEVGEFLAMECGIDTLSETQRKVISFLREFYDYYARAPLNHKLKEGTGLSLLELEALFPGGIKYGAHRLAGIPNPKRTCV